MKSRVNVLMPGNPASIYSEPRRPVWMIFVLCFQIFNCNSRALTNGVALTPPMGYNSWYNHGAYIDETLIKSIADQMATNGMLAAGYQYINLDDGWAGNRDTNGVMVADTTKFPSGMKALADYVHAKGFKIGLYTTSSTNTCAKYPGSVNHVDQDIRTYAQWGIDYLKYEGCNLSLFEIIPRGQIYCARLTQAMAKAGRPMVYSCSVGAFEKWMPQYINLWRGTGDLGHSWDIILSHIDIVSQTSSFAGPGRWNDPDVLQIGDGFFQDYECASIFSMWCMLSAPLLALTSSTTHTNIFCNTEAIAVDQDPAGIQGVCVATNGDLQVWRKPIGGSNSTTLAVALFNRGNVPGDITVNWSDVGLPAGVAVARDLWDHADAGNFTNSYTAKIPGHSVQLLKLTYGATMPLPSAGTNYLSQLPWMSGASNDVVFPNNAPFVLNLAGSMTPLTLRGVTYTNGLGTIAYSRVNYFLGGVASRFQSDIGLDDIAAQFGAVVFRIYADGAKVYDSGVMTTQTPTQTVDLDLTGKKVLTLEVTNGVSGIVNDYADWAGARITVLSLPPPTPAGLNAVAGTSQFNISWYATSGAATYHIKRSTTPGSGYTTLATTSIPGFFDTNIAVAVTYYYVVSAINAYGKSANSPEISVSTSCYWVNTITAEPQNWSFAGNWTNTSQFPNGRGASAVVNSGPLSSQTINLNQTITLSSLTLGSSNGLAPFTIAGINGSLVFDNDQGIASLIDSAASAGDMISAPLKLNSSLIVNNLSTNLLALSGPISGLGALVFNGPGQVMLAGTNSFAGAITLQRSILTLGNDAALGATNGGTTINSGAILDLHGFSVGAESITVAGSGINNLGVLVNNPTTAKTSTAQFVTLTGDTTFGGTANWDLRASANPPTAAALGAGGNAFALTKSGTNQITLAGVDVDSALGDINVQNGVLGLESTTTSLGDPNHTLTVQPGAALSFSHTSTPWNKRFALNGDGANAPLINIEGNNIMVGPVSLTGSCLVSVATGSLSLNGPVTGTGSIVKTLGGWLGLGGTNSYAGDTIIQGGTLAVLDSASLIYSLNVHVSDSTVFDVSALTSGFTFGPGQTLSGSGTVSGNVTIGSNATLAPASSNGVITFNNSLTLGPGASCVLAASDYPKTNERVRVLDTLTYGGKLILTNSANKTFAAGDTFKLFDAPHYAGGFSVIIPQVPGLSLIWDSSSLITNGTLRVVIGTTPHFNSAQVAGTDLVLNGAGGASNALYYILSTTNLALPLKQWSRIATNHFDANGNFFFTTIRDPNTPETFYSLQSP